MPRRMWVTFFAAGLLLAVGALHLQTARAEQAAPTDGAASRIVWEPIPSIRTDTRFEGTVYRAKVPGGWLVDYNGLTFYPDPEHGWDGSAAAE